MVSLQGRELTDGGEADPEAGADSPAPKAPEGEGRFTALDLGDKASVRSMLKMGTHLGLILLYSWLCENRPLFAHGTKHTSRDHFWFLALVR
jgi:hypothetical protein